jgi:hypothetical protein
MVGRSAVGAAVIVGFLSAPAAGAAEMLNGDQIREALVGNTFSGLMEASEGGPSPYAEYYDPDGTIRGEGYSGHWTIEGDTMCLAYEQSPKACWQLGTEGDEVQWILNGNVEGSGKIAPGNPNSF